jgi:hypothetical protein
MQTTFSCKTFPKPRERLTGIAMRDARRMLLTEVDVLDETDDSLNYQTNRLNCAEVMPP